MEMGQMMSLFKDLNKKQRGTGMADDVPATIGGGDPAALSEGEYVIPADVVAMLGDGNTQAGAEMLDKFIEQVRMAKQGGTKEQAPPLSEALPKLPKAFKKQ